MGDTENDIPPSKKRVAGRQLSRDNPGLDDEEDASEQEAGTFQRASDEVLATRRIVKVRRHQPPTETSSNPFAGIRLVPSSGEKPVDVNAEAQVCNERADSERIDRSDQDKETEVAAPYKKDENEKWADQLEADSSASKDNGDPVNEATEPKFDNKNEALEEETQDRTKKDVDQEIVATSAAETPFSSFQQLSSSQNAFTGLAGTGFSSSTFSFGSIEKDGSVVGASSGSLFELKGDKPSSFPSFSFGNSSNGGSSLFGSAGASNATKNEGSGLPTMQEVPVETGEENEKAVFTADAVLFEFLDGGWKERGKGEVKVNVSADGSERSRLVMRAKGNYRLILNASLYPDMKLTNMEKRGITFACMNSAVEGKDNLGTFALKFKDGSIVEEFRAAVNSHKGKKAMVIKTPENSPKTSED